MSEIAIHAEGLGKRYRVAPVRARDTLRDAISAGWKSARRRLSGTLQLANSETFWALRGISFDIPRGQATGIIGGNGAGKSTLLKILSRITEPTVGHARLTGRVGSLLEVGTGFHAELTGRENIYLNGAILGMKRAEIASRFDEIVAFAEVERFIDTPVKHYSSGMYLRLAFAVAAHLEPEVLIVDEVLAVGDAAFQRKCLGRMEDVTREGRTVLFVSHNMDAIRRLCSSSILLEKGRIAEAGPTEGVVAAYLSRDIGAAGPLRSIDLTNASRRGSGEVRFASAAYRSYKGEIGEHAYPGGPLQVFVHVVSNRAREVDSFALSIRTLGGTLLINADVVSHGVPVRLRAGENRVVFRIESLPLNPGRYVVGLWAGDTLATVLDHLLEAFQLEVVSMRRDGFGVTPQNNGAVACDFTIESLDATAVEEGASEPRRDAVDAPAGER